MPEFVGPFDAPDRYRLIELRSRGCEGELWRAAIGVDGDAAPLSVRIFRAASPLEHVRYAATWQRQAELLGNRGHPNLVTVRDAFEGPAPHAAGAASSEPAAVYVVVDWAPGETLPAWVARHPDRDALDVARIVTRVAAAVGHLHSGKATGGVPVLHRDLKPANVVLDGAEIRLVDFGFARLVGEQLTELSAYLAPELVGGATPTKESDRYGVGAIAYLLLTGEDPVRDAARLRARLLNVPGLEGRDEVVNQVLAMLATDPARRPKDIVEWSRKLTVGTSVGVPTTTRGVDDALISRRSGLPRLLQSVPD